MSDVLLTRPRSEASRITLAGYGRFLPAVFAAATTIALPSSRGGYFPVSWNWATLALAWVAALALLLSSRMRLGKLELAAVGGAFAYVLWMALSTMWSTAVPSTVLEVQRALVYPVGVLAALLLTRTSTVSNLLAGVLAGTTGVCAYALLTRLFPDQIATADLFGGYRLSVPLGYWNGLAVLAVIGMLLALGFSAHSRSLLGRALAAASLLVLVPTLFFTYSRGGSIALSVGLAVAVAIDSRRLWLVTVLMVVVPPAALAVWLGSRYDALTHVGATLEQAAHDGHRFALEIALLAAAAAAGATVLGVAQRHFARPSLLVRRAYGTAVLIAVTVVLLAGFGRYGSPWSLAQRGYTAITAKPTSDATTSLNKAFFNLSQQGRIEQWKAAWRDHEAHPWLGSGAGSYGRYWFQHRQSAYQVRDAHSLYMEALAELGPVGLALVVGFLLVPLAAAVRARRRRLVPFAAAAYCGYLFHAGVDWDWEQTGVTLTALLCGAALLVAARRPDGERRTFAPWVRFAAPSPRAWTRPTADTGEPPQATRGLRSAGRRGRRRDGSCSARRSSS